MAALSYPSKITPEYVETLTSPTPDFLCSLDDNIYGIEFTAFKIRSIDEATNISSTHFEVHAEDGTDNPNIDFDPSELTDEARRIKYHFGPAFLDLKTVGTELEFIVKSDNEVRNLRMIERHYFRNKVIKSFDFCMPYCIPRSKNTWEIIYCMPDEDTELTPELKQEIVGSPWETKSDSFYFVDDKLIMHNKAEYNYSPIDGSEEE